MGIFKNIKIKIKNYALKKASDSKPVLEFVNWRNVSSVQLLFTRYDDTTADIMSRFARELVKQNKKVDVLIYVNKKKLDPLFENRNSVAYFSRKDVSWLGKPKSELVKEFMNKKSDLLFVPVFEPAFVIKRIAVMCKTKTIAAPFSPANDWANVLIKLENRNIDDFFTQTIRYLDIINNT